MVQNANPFEDLTRQQLLRDGAGLSVEVSKRLSDTVERERIWRMIHRGFIDLNGHSYEKQDMTHKEFRDDADSDEVLKYVARNKRGKVAGFMSVHVGLGNVSWANTDRLQEIQDSVDPTAVSYYIGTIVVPISLRGTRVAARLLQASYLHFQQANTETHQNSLCFFDCSQANYPRIGKFAHRANRADDAFPGVPLAITEEFVEYWAQDAGAKAAPRKIAQLPEDGSAKVVDAQHFYSVRVLPTP